MKLFLVRHGQSVGNAERKFYGKGDVDLSIEGVYQAENMALKFEGMKISKLYSSPLKRAYNTALEISKVTNKKIIVDDLLMEINIGIFEGLTFEEIQNKYPEEATKWLTDITKYKFINGESFSEVLDRANEFLKKVEDNSVIVCHSGIIQALIVALGVTDKEGSLEYVINNCDVLCVENSNAHFLY